MTDARHRLAHWLGFCAGIKPFFRLFAIALVIQKRWRAAAAMAAVGMAMLGIGVMVIGVDEYVAWARQLAAVSWAEHYMNASILGLLERAFSTTPWGQHPLTDLPMAIRPLWIGAATVIALVSAARWRKWHDADRTFLITSAAMLLLSPLGWVYYFWFLLPPLLALLIRGDGLSGRARRLVWIGLAATFVPNPVPWLSFMTGAMTSTLGSIYAWGLLLLWLGAIRSPTPTPETAPLASPDRGHGAGAHGGRAALLRDPIVDLARTMDIAQIALDPHPHAAHRLAEALAERRELVVHARRDDRMHACERPGRRARAARSVLVSIFWLTPPTRSRMRVKRSPPPASSSSMTSSVHLSATAPSISRARISFSDSRSAVHPLDGFHMVSMELIRCLIASGYREL